MNRRTLNLCIIIELKYGVTVPELIYIIMATNDGLCIRMFSILSGLHIFWTLFFTAQTICHVISAQLSNDVKVVWRSSSSFGEVTSHPMHSSTAEENRRNAKKEGSAVEGVMKKDLLNPSLFAKHLEMCCSTDETPGSEFQKIRSAIVSPQETNESACCSILKAALANPFNVPCHENKVHNLINILCSLLKTNQRTWRKELLSKSSPLAQYLQRYFTIPSHPGYKAYENVKSKHPTPNRTKRFTNWSNGVLSLSKINGWLINAEKLMDNISKDDMGSNSLNVQIYLEPTNREEIFNTFKNVHTSAELLVESLTSAEQQQTIMNKEKLTSNDWSELVGSSKLKRAKVKPDFTSGTDNNKKKNVLDSLEGVTAKLVQGSKSCSLRLETSVLAVPGCIPKSVVITRCHGSCPSRSVPEWRVDSLYYVDKCTCCMPLQYRIKKFDLECPSKKKGQATVRRVNLAYPFKCMCRPCENVPDIKAEQPYDY
ncbi:neuroblastoma suppressor of tumorigenicity 1 [Biomphalaria pfeifferi]|uniref:Neuroblastoma suppressor of tumorigenicity 1 n=1 Tax=Biomphalaria pfeifferi TaxID=112525 RepID=A0AAD8ATI6_BIOPF|nr:neuroblastoma suppressor of tumorigenicity 1 [Biomphalaria pfeifferi]